MLFNGLDDFNFMSSQTNLGKPLNSTLRKNYSIWEPASHEFHQIMHISIILWNNRPRDLEGVKPKKGICHLLPLAIHRNTTESVGDFVHITGTY